MIQGFYDTFALLERYSAAVDENGQEIRTWSPSTTIKGCKQNRSGSKAIGDNLELVTKSDMFYCDIKDITEKDRLLFSTAAWSFAGVSTGSSSFSTSVNMVYYLNNAYVVTNSTGYASFSWNYRNILNVYNLRERHLQITLDKDYGYRS